VRGQPQATTSMGPDKETGKSLVCLLLVLPFSVAFLVLVFFLAWCGLLLAFALDVAVVPTLHFSF
jgi:hypothetical protein